MPITDYSKTVIYVIKCKDDNITEQYIGSTTNFRSRKNQHKSCCNNEKHKEYNCKKYQFMREHGGWDNWLMIQLEEYSCENKRQAESREEEIRVERKAQLNMKRAFVNGKYHKIYREENKEDLKEKGKIYREKNRGILAEKTKIYREKNKDILREKKRIYHEQNKEKIYDKRKEYFKQQYQKKKEEIKKWEEDNKEKIKERKRQYYQKKKAEKLLNKQYNEPAESNQTA